MQAWQGAVRDVTVAAARIQINRTKEVVERGQERRENSGHLGRGAGRQRRRRWLGSHAAGCAGQRIHSQLMLTALGGALRP